MSDIATVDRSNGKKENTPSIDSLKAELETCRSKIKSITNNGKKDMTQLTDNDKSQLRALYIKMVETAKKVSELSTDDEDKVAYDQLANKLTDMAIKYGSNVKAQVPTTTFDDVIGLEEAKNLVESFTFIAEHPELAKTYNIEGGLGLLLYGAPGTGKTMFAEAVANKLKYALFTVKPSEIFNSHVGESEKAVKKLFEDIHAIEGGTVLFIDECESLFGSRKEDTDDYKIAVTNELLQGMNGFGQDKNQTKHVMIAATNTPWLIDSAYLRFKRFSYQVHIQTPNQEAIAGIITKKLSTVPHAGISDDEIAHMIWENYEKYKNRWSAADVCGALEEMCRRTLEEVREDYKNNGGIIQLKDLSKETIKKVIDARRGSITPKEYEKFEMFRQSKSGN